MLYNLLKEKIMDLEKQLKGKVLQQYKKVTYRKPPLRPKNMELMLPTNPPTRPCFCWVSLSDLSAALVPFTVPKSGRWTAFAFARFRRVLCLCSLCFILASGLDFDDELWCVELLLTFDDVSLSLRFSDRCLRLVSCVIGLLYRVV